MKKPLILHGDFDRAVAIHRSELIHGELSISFIPGLAQKTQHKKPNPKKKTQKTHCKKKQPKVGFLSFLKRKAFYGLQNA